VDTHTTRVVRAPAGARFVLAEIEDRLACLAPVPAGLPRSRLDIMTEDVRTAAVPVVAVVPEVEDRAVTVVTAVDQPEALAAPAPTEPAGRRKCR
jgi:hypothetical protein